MISSVITTYFRRSYFNVGLIGGKLLSTPRHVEYQIRIEELRNNKLCLSNSINIGFMNPMLK